MTKSENLRRLLQKKRTISRAETIFMLFAWVIAFVGVFALCITKQISTIITIGVTTMIIGIPIIIVTIITGRKVISYTEKQIAIIKEDIFNTVCNFGIDSADFAVTAQHLYHYKIKLKNNDINFGKLNEKLKQSLKWSECILNKDITVKLIYEYESEL